MASRFPPRSAFSELWQAVINNEDLDELVRLLAADSEGPDSECPHIGMRLLHATCIHKNVAFALHLCERGAGINMRCSVSGQPTPLHVAASVACNELCRALILKGADPALKLISTDGDGDGGDDDKITEGNCFQVYGSKVMDGEMTQARYDEGSFLMMLARKEFLGEPVDAIDEKSDHHFTYLHKASDRSFGEAVVVLCDRGADIDKRSAEALGQVTPLHCASAAGNIAICKFLIGRGANPLLEMTMPDDEPGPNAYGLFGRAIDEQALTFLQLWRGVHELKAARAAYLGVELDPDEADAEIDGFTALHMMCMMQESDQVAALLVKGANPNLQADAAMMRMTPLHIAAAIANPGLCQLLLSHGADPAIERERPGTGERQTAQEAYGANIEGMDTALVLAGRAAITEARAAYLVLQLQKKRDANWARRSAFMQVMVSCRFHPLLEHQEPLQVPAPLVVPLPSETPQQRLLREVFASNDAWKVVASFL